MIIVDMSKYEVCMTKDKEIMTAKEVAEYLSIHPLTVHKYAREGKIPAFKIGTDWRFHKKHIERWIKEKSASGMYARAHKGPVLDKI
jgi:excisionase family DNA binding protein